MENENSTQTTERYLTTLAARLDELIRDCDKLAEENRSLRTQQVALLAEKDTLIRQNEQLRARIDAIVMRLRGLEETP